MKPYIVTYITDDCELKEKLVYAVDKEAAARLIEDTISVKGWDDSDEK